MNPLSPFTYTRRHKRHAALLISLSVVVTAGLYVLVALVWGTFVEPPRRAYMALSEFSIVTPRTNQSAMSPALVDQIQANPDVAKVLPTITIRTQLPGSMGQDVQFDFLGLAQEDMPYILARLDATLKEGRLPEPRSNELLLSLDLAKMVGVEVGDHYDVVSSEFYINEGRDGPPKPVAYQVVGILESDIELGLVSLEFLNAHEQYRHFPLRFLVAAQEKQKPAVDDFLRNEIMSSGADVMTLGMLNERILTEALPGLVMMLPVVLIVACAFSLIIVVVNHLSNARRLPEFGFLHATGQGKGWLARRLTMESTTLALAGWVIGVGLAYLGLNVLKVTVFATQGYDLDYVVWVPVLFSLPYLVVVAGLTFITVRRTLKRLDPVGIIERREQSQESEGRQHSTAMASSPRPLAPATFFRRHRRRAILLVGSMALMIIAVTMFIFALAVGADAQEPFLGYLARISIVRSPGIVQGLDPAVAARVAAHPAVERVIPVAPRSHMLGVNVPPFTTVEASPFGVSGADMAHLVELYGLALERGRLPHPGSNEMVIPYALAQNRDIDVGDVIGAPDQPAYPGAPSLPVAFVISGVFAPPKTPDGGGGLGFVSLEFLENNRPFPLPDVLPLIVVPKTGQKNALDDWLENELAGVGASVLTHRQELSRIRAKAQQDMTGIALLEVVIAFVAAVGLVVLNYIFVSQRQAEFGVLHALGYGRWQLVRRVFAETAFTTGIAWGLSAILGLVGLLCLRIAVFGPLGLAFGLFSITPWLYTLPIPVVVLTVAAGATAWTLSRLDPISIIERRL